MPPTNMQRNRVSTRHRTTYGTTNAPSTQGDMSAFEPSSATPLAPGVGLM